MQLTCLPFYAYTFFPQVIDEMKGKDLEAIIAEGTGKFAKVCISMHTCFKYYTYTDGTQRQTNQILHVHRRHTETAHRDKHKSMHRSCLQSQRWLARVT